MIVIDYFYPPNSQKRFEAATDTITIGRAAPGQPIDLDLAPDTAVSRRHARITYENDAYWLEDLGSRYGTWVNDQKITVKRRLMPGDKVKMGRTTMEMFIPEDGILDSKVKATELPPDLLLTKEIDLSSIKTIRRRLLAFYELGLALGTVDAVEPLLKTVVEHLCKVVPDAQRGALLLQENDGLTAKAYAPEQIQPSVSLNLAKLAIAKQAAFTWRRGAPGETGMLFDSVIRHGTQAAMYAPLIWKDEVLGVVFVDNFEKRQAFDEDDLRLLMAMANQVAMFVKNHVLQQDLRRQEVIRSNLMRQFSPQVAERLRLLLRESEGLQLGGERAEPVTILSLDVRGFTRLSAQMEPHEVVAMLNELFGICTPIIFKHNGTIDKYVGDAILAVFGSPDPDDQQWEKAVRAALELQQAIHELGQARKNRGLPVCRVGIGLHTGPVLHGFIGSEEHMEYTIIGDTVNRASRYCDGAGPGEVVISEGVYQQVADLVEVMPKVVKPKHPENEGNLAAYVIKGLKS